jgi:hypothetical protein
VMFQKEPVVRLRNGRTEHAVFHWGEEQKLAFSNLICLLLFSFGPSNHHNFIFFRKDWISVRA